LDQPPLKSRAFSSNPGFDPGRRPGFWVGVTSVLHSFAFVLKTPRVWPAAAVPAVVLLVLTTSLLVVSFSILRPLISSWLPSAQQWSWAPDADVWTWLRVTGGNLAAWLVPWLAAILSSLLGFFAALALTPPLSAPALERIVALRERTLGVGAREPLGFVAEVWCGLKAQMWAALFAIPVLSALWIVELLFPIASMVIVPVKCLVVSVCLAWNLFDYPLTLRGVGMRERFAVISTHWRPTLGFGLAFSALFWVPCCGVLFLPVAVAGATSLLWWILLFDRQVAPTVRRPGASTDSSQPAAPAQLPGARPRSS
jgi:CysZ protein